MVSTIYHQTKENVLNQIKKIKNNLKFLKQLKKTTTMQQEPSSPSPTAV